MIGVRVQRIGNIVLVEDSVELNFDLASPYFTIIVPVYNREATVGRALNSCLIQSFDDFEIIAVDDGSTDCSADVIINCSDQRVRLIRHTSNRGPCPARNTGVREARGKWLVMLDSDFSLLPDALDTLYQATQVADSRVGNVAFSCLWDREWKGGYITPLPEVPNDVLDYVGYLRWSDTLYVSEYLNCIRHEAFGQVHYPESRAWEASFHLDLALKWNLSVDRRAIVRVHTDAPNRLTTGRGDWAYGRLLLESRDKLIDQLYIWERHGNAIRQFAPLRYTSMLRESGRLHLLLGERKKALPYFRHYLRKRPRDLKAWIVFGIGLLGPKPLAWVASHR